MKFDKSLLRTVLFALGVVAFVIGTYQTLFFNDLTGNYWIFMLSLACWMPLLYWRQQETLAAKIAEQKAKLARENQRKPGTVKPKKRR